MRWGERFVNRRGDEEGGWLVGRLKVKVEGGGQGRASVEARAGGVGSARRSLWWRASAARGAVVMPLPVAVGLRLPRVGLAGPSRRPAGTPAPWLQATDRHLGRRRAALRWRRRQRAG